MLILIGVGNAWLAHLKSLHFQATEAQRHAFVRDTEELYMHLCKMAAISLGHRAAMLGPPGQKGSSVHPKLIDTYASTREAVTHVYEAYDFIILDGANVSRKLAP